MIPARVLCLDWDKRSLRFVSARVARRSVKLDDAHSHRLPPDIDADKPDALGEFIKQTLARHRVGQKRVIVDVPRDQAVINRLRVPPTPDSELAAAVQFQAQRELPFSVDEAVIDYAVMQRDEKGLATEILLAAVRHETLDRVQRTCKAAGLTPARVGLRPYANVVAVSQLPGLLDQRVLLLEVGPALTEIDVVHRGKLLFSRAASVGVPFQAGELVTEDSRISSKAELAELELADAAQSEAIDDLLVEITRTLQAYRATEDDATIDQIVIAGGTGLEPALLAAVEERFRIPVALFDPTVALGVPERESTKLRSFSAVLGLVWGVSRNGLLEIDFLNPKKPIERSAIVKRQMRLAGVTAAAAVLGAIYLIWSDRASLQREYDSLKTMNADYSKELLAFYEIDNKTVAARHWEEGARMTVLLEHLLRLTNEAPEPGKQLIASDLRWSAPRAGLDLKLSCSDITVANQFVERINDIADESGRRLYRATPGAWQETRTVDPRFAGTIDVAIQVLPYEAHLKQWREMESRLETRVRDLRR